MSWIYTFQKGGQWEYVPVHLDKLRSDQRVSLSSSPLLLSPVTGSRQPYQNIWKRKLCSKSRNFLCLFLRCTATCRSCRSDPSQCAIRWSKLVWRRIACKITYVMRSLHERELHRRILLWTPSSCCPSSQYCPIRHATMQLLEDGWSPELYHWGVQFCRGPVWPGEYFE